MVTTFDDRENLLCCLESVKAALGEGYRIAVWDDGSRDGTREAVATAFPEVILGGDGANHGVARGRNRAMALAGYDDYDLVWVLDSDAVVDGATLPPLLELLAARPEVAAVAPVVVYADGPGRVWSAGLSVSYREVVASDPLRDRPVAALPAEPFVVDAAVTNGLLIRTSALARAGLFDEAFHFCLAEVDLCQRFRSRVGQVVVCPRARLRHKPSQSLGGSYSLLRGYHTGWSCHRFLSKHARWHQWARFGLFFSAALVAGSLRQWLRGGPAVPREKLRGFLDARAGRREPPTDREGGAS